MLLQVDEFVINTDQIKFIQKEDGRYGLSLKITFDKDNHVNISFPNEQDMDRFLDKLGERKYFA